jgi:hypothetical protein
MYAYFSPCWSLSFGMAISFIVSGEVVLKTDQELEREALEGTPPLSPFSSSL